MGSSTIVFFLAACALGNSMVVQPSIAQYVSKPQAPPQAARKPAAPPAFVPAAAGRRPQPPIVAKTVSVTTTVTVFGPVAIETITNTVTATQMINAGTTTDIRLNDHTTSTFDYAATVTSRTYVPRQAETVTSFVTATNGQAGGVTTQTEVESRSKTVTLTNTRFSTTTAKGTSTIVVEHFSTAIDIEIVPIMMRTTVFQTSTLTTVGVVRVQTTIINPDLYY